MHTIGDSVKKLALLGGDPVRKEPFPAYKSLGEEEKKAVMEALGNISMAANACVDLKMHGRKNLASNMRFR
jgi:hypothetical protein